MSSRSLAWLAAFVLLGAFVCRLHSFGSLGQEDRSRVEREVMSEVRRKILDRYVDDVDDEKLFYGALRGMVGVLDVHSQFLTPEDYEEMSRQTTGKFGGLGMEISQDARGILTVVTPLIGTPAHRAGILPGDRIFEVDGRATKGLSVDQAANLMRGEPDTKVTLTVLHEGESETVEMTLTREVIHVRSVKLARFLDGEPKVGYVLLSRFQEDSAEALGEALTRLESGGMRGLVLDLRMNYGGLLDVAVAVCDLFIEEGMIVETRGRGGRSLLGDREEKDAFAAKKDGTHPKYPIAVLVDEGTASAAEICAGALRDYDRAFLVGEKTYGKGSVQTLMPVDIGPRKQGALKLTTAYYYLPKGEKIHGKGLEPDVAVQRTREQTRGLLNERHRLWLNMNNPDSGNGPAKAEKRPGGDPKQDEKPFVDEQMGRAVECLRKVIAGEPMPRAPKPAEKTDRQPAAP